MAATTRWKDTVETDFNTAVRRLIDEVVSDERITNISWDNWTFNKIYDENQQIRLGDHDIEYNTLEN